MPEASTDMRLKARKVESSVVKRVHALSQVSVADATGMDPSTLSRLLSEHLPKLALVMAHVGIRTADEGKRCFDPQYVEALMQLARRHMQSASANQLEWEDDA